MPSLTIDLDPNSELHKRILDAVRDRVDASKQAFQGLYTKWRKAEEKAIAFIPERDVDVLRRNKREAGSPQYTTIQIPYSYAILMASHTYWTTVFMSRTPVLQYTGRHGEPQQNVQALEALIDYQVQVGQMLVPWYIWFHDVGKYGIGIVGIYWDQQFSTISSIEEQEEMFLGIIPTGKIKKIKRSQRVMGYEGNCVYNLRPYDFFPDPRVTMGDFQKGEFVSVYRRIGWNTLLKRADLGYYTNLELVRPGKEPLDGARTEGSPQLELPKADSFFFMNSRNQKNLLENAIIPFYETYIDLIPSEWGLGKGDLPEKWVFTSDAWHRVVIGASPLGANHDKFPFATQILEPEGYQILPRGMPEILEPVQNTVDWLLNSHFYNVRKILNGQYVVDPSRIMLTDMLDPNPGGIIRAKEAAYGEDMRTAVHQLQATDVTTNHLRDMQVMQMIGERAVGVNEQIMGQMMQGGRRTAQEVRSANTFGISRLKTNAEMFSAQAWSPMSQMLVQNTQQYYSQDKQFRIAGDLMGQVGPQFMNVTPESILGFYDYVTVDGTLPIDRFAQANLWREMFVAMRNMPDIAQQYDLGKLFAWVAQLAGLKNINQFKIQAQVVPDQMMAQQAQAGNVVPMPGRMTPPQSMGNAPEPGQLSGMGTTG